MSEDGVIRVVLVTCPTSEVGDALARELVARGLVACVNLVPGVRSIYRWKGEICEDQEVMLVMKTTLSQVGELMEVIPSLHPYEVPEILALQVDSGLPAYLAWVRGAVGALP